MKKIILASFIVSLLVSSVNAQIKKGSIFLGGDIGGSGQKTKTNGQTTNKQGGITVSPVFGKAIKDNLIVGVMAGVGFYNSETDISTYESKSDSYSGALFVRKYKKLGTSDFYIFAQASAGVGHYTQTLTGPAPNLKDETKRFSAGITAYPGLSYAVSNRVHLETGFNNLVSLTYSSEKRDAGNPAISYKTNAFSVSSSLNNATSSLFLGVRVLLGKG